MEWEILVDLELWRECGVEEGGALLCASRVELPFRDREREEAKRRREGGSDARVGREVPLIWKSVLRFITLDVKYNVLQSVMGEIRWEEKSEVRLTRLPALNIRSSTTALPNNAPSSSSSSLLSVSLRSINPARPSSLASPSPSLLPLPVFGCGRDIGGISQPNTEVRLAPSNRCAEVDEETRLDFAEVDFVDFVDRLRSE
jgi:hypothetical protein